MCCSMHPQLTHHQPKKVYLQGSSSEQGGSALRMLYFYNKLKILPAVLEKEAIGPKTSKMALEKQHRQDVRNYWCPNLDNNKFNVR